MASPDCPSSPSAPKAGETTASASPARATDSTRFFTLSSFLPFRCQIAPQTGARPPACAKFVGPRPRRCGQNTSGAAASSTSGTFRAQFRCCKLEAKGWTRLLRKERKSIPQYPRRLQADEGRLCQLTGMRLQAGRMLQGEALGTKEETPLQSGVVLQRRVRDRPGSQKAQVAARASWLSIVGPRLAKPASRFRCGFRL